MTRRRTAALTLCLALSCTVACKREGTPADSNPLARESDGAFAERRDEGRLKAVVGSWALVDGELGAAAAQFVERHRAVLEIPEGAELSEPRLQGLSGNTIAFDLLRDGHLVFGGDVRVHTGGTGQVYRVTVLGPTGFEEAVDSISAEEAEAAALEHLAGYEVASEPLQRWFALDTLYGEAGVARLVWWVPTRDPATGDLASVSVDAEDGSVVWEAGREATYWVRDANQGEDHEAIDKTPLIADGDTLPVEDADPEAVQAHELTVAACSRQQAVYATTALCDTLGVYADFGKQPGYAAATCNWDDEDWAEYERSGRCVHSRLKMGAEAWSWGSARFIYEHELWHAMVHLTAPLADGGQPASVNEAYADLNAVMATRPSGDWLATVGTDGEDSYRIVRNITDPSKTNMPDDYLDGLILWPDQSRGIRDIDIDHGNSTILSHGVYRAAVLGGTVGDKTWRPIPFAQIEQLLYLASTNGPGESTTLRDAAAELIFQCVGAVLTEKLDGDAGDPPHGLREAHCAAIANAMAEVSLSEPDSDLDGLPDDTDPCPDKPDIMQLIEYDDDSNNCEPEPEPDPGEDGLCPPTLETSRGTATLGEPGPCDFQPSNKAAEHDHECFGCAYKTSAGDEAYLQISTAAGEPRECQPLGEIEPYATVFLNQEYGIYAALSFGWIGELVDFDEARNVIDQVAPRLVDYAADCSGSAFGFDFVSTTGPSVSAENGPPASLLVSFAGNPAYPITVTAPAGMCSAELDCSERTVEFGESEVTTVDDGTVRRFEWTEAVSCVAASPDGPGSSIDLQLTDALGTQANIFPARIWCWP